MDGNAPTESNILTDQPDWFADDRLSESQLDRYSSWMRLYAASLLAPTEPTPPAMKKIALVLLCTLLALPALAVEDTKANREQQAARYLLATPPKEVIDDMTDQMAKTMPPDERAAFKSILALIDIEAVTKIMKEAMIKNFTADELKALADFYGSPAGRSATKKQGSYMVDVMPGLQQEVVRAVSKAAQAAQEKK